MISELYCIDKAADFHELMKSTFVACQHNMDSIAVPPSFISTVSEFAVKDIRISSTIDFPIGLSDTSVRILTKYNTGGLPLVKEMWSRCYHNLNGNNRR